MANLPPAATETFAVFQVLPPSIEYLYDFTDADSVEGLKVMRAEESLTVTGVVFFDAEDGRCGSGIVTLTDFDGSRRVVWEFPARSEIAKNCAAERVDTTVPPPARAVDVAEITHLVGVPCSILSSELISVTSKSVEAVDDNVEQSIASLLETEKLIATTDDVSDGVASVTGGAIESMTIVREADLSDSFFSASACVLETFHEPSVKPLSSQVPPAVLPTMVQLFDAVEAITDTVPTVDSSFTAVTVTVPPDSAVLTDIDTVESFVRSSLDETPESDDATKSGAVGAEGAVASVQTA